MRNIFVKARAGRPDSGGVRVTKTETPAPRPAPSNSAAVGLTCMSARSKRSAPATVAP